METVIAACLLVAFLACVAVIGMTLGYNVELTFHPPIFIKLKLTRTGEPESRRVQEPMTGCSAEAVFPRVRQTSCGARLDDAVVLRRMDPRKVLHRN